MASLAPVTGVVYANTSCLLAFRGAAGVAVNWAVSSGGGSISFSQDFTDNYGRAYAIYTAGGYEGAVTITATYGV